MLSRPERVTEWNMRKLKDAFAEGGMPIVAQTR